MDIKGGGIFAGLRSLLNGGSKITAQDVIAHIRQGAASRNRSCEPTPREAGEALSNLLRRCCEGQHQMRRQPPDTGFEHARPHPPCEPHKPAPPKFDPPVFFMPLPKPCPHTGDGRIPL